MDKIAGEISEAKERYLVKEIELWQGQIDEAQAELDKYYSGELEYNSNAIETLEKKIEKLNEAKSVVEDLYIDTAELKELKNEGYNVGYVNNISYNMYIGNESVDVNNLDAVLLIAFLVMTTSLIWSVDNQNNMMHVIRTTKKGRANILVIKTGISFLITFVGHTILYIMRFSQIDGTYGLNNMGLSANSLKIFRNLDADMSIMSIIVIVYILRLLSLWMTVCIVGYISYKTKTNMHSLTINAVLFIFPAYLYYAGVDAMKYISSVKCVSVVSLWLDNKEEMMLFTMAFVVLFAVSLSAIVKQIRESVR